MERKKRLLFFGELPQDSVHGISIANEINLKMLESGFAIDRIEEYSRLAEHNKVTFNKIIDFIKNSLTIALKSISRVYSYFYLTFSLSFFGSFKSLAAIISFRLFSKGKVVLHLHRGDFFTRFYKSIFNRIITKLVFRLSHKIIVLTENQKKIFENTFNRPFYILPNTVEFEYEPALKTKSNNNFIFISNYLIDKGIIDLLDVFTLLTRHHKELTIKTYGEFSDHKLKDLISSYNSSNIHINGPIRGLQKFKEISHSDCLILPSWNEGQPIVLLEAMSVGTPIIASRTGLIPELLGEDYPFLTVPADKESLEKKIISFINLKDLTDISDRLIDRYRRYYSQKKHAESLNRIFI